MKLGCDIGNVIIGRDTDDPGSTPLMFTQDYMKAEEISGAIDTLGWLNKRSPFRDNVYLVSKAGESVQRKTREWLVSKDFVGITGIAEDRWRFCEHRHEKIEIAKKYELTHFIDDRLEILGSLREVCTGGLYLFRGKAREIREHVHHFNAVTIVESWKELRLLLGCARMES